MPSMLPLPFAACARPRCLRTTRATNPGLSTIDGQRFCLCAPNGSAASQCNFGNFEQPEPAQHRMHRRDRSPLAARHKPPPILLPPPSRFKTSTLLASSDARRARGAKNTAKTHWSLLSALKWGRSRLDDSVQTRRKPADRRLVISAIIRAVALANASLQLPGTLCASSI
jgi:hypothetical protein